MFIVLIKSIADKKKNNYYHNIFLEKGSYKDINLTQNIFKWMFVYYKWYISIELTF